jgi:hypothetical protein
MNGNIVIIIWAGLIVLFVILYRYSLPVHYYTAKGHEKAKDYKNACYFYALAVLNSTSKNISEKSRSKVKLLWEKYGPFDYSDILDYNTRIDPRPKGDIDWLAGQIDIVKAVIQDVTASDQNSKKI